MKIVSLLREVRLSRGMSQPELAELAGLSQPGLSRIERGLRGARVETLEKLARVLSVKVTDLYLVKES